MALRGSVYPTEQDSCYPCDHCLFFTERVADNSVVRDTSDFLRRKHLYPVEKKVLPQHTENHNSAHVTATPKELLDFVCTCEQAQVTHSSRGENSRKRPANSCGLESDRENIGVLQLSGLAKHDTL